MSSLQTLDVPGFQVMQYLGRGACSTIWQIRDRQSGELFALKRVMRRSADDERAFDHALNECRVAAKLDHIVVRKILRIRRIRRWLKLHEIHIIMEFCRGYTLQEKRPTSMAEIVSIFGAVTEGLSHMHARGYLHADIKPNNIIVAPDGTVKILDLGQSCPLGIIKDRIQGTPDFIAPEQVHRRPLDARTDIFNFGAALYWTLTGRPIPTQLPKEGAVTFLAEQVIEPIEKFSPDSPLAIRKLVGDCIENHPGNRPSAMTEVGSRLALIAHTLSARPETPPPAADDTAELPSETPQ